MTSVKEKDDQTHPAATPGDGGPVARDALVAALVEQRVQKLGASIRAIDGSGNADTPEGLLVRRIVDAFAEYERLTIQARTGDGRALASANDRQHH